LGISLRENRASRPFAVMYTEGVSSESIRELQQLGFQTIFVGKFRISKGDQRDNKMLFRWRSY
jgi:hypothetical protein